MKKKLFSILLVVVLALSLVQFSFGNESNACNLQSGVGISVLQPDISDSKNIPGYVEDNKGNMVEDDNGDEYGSNPYITITYVKDASVATVHYHTPYVNNEEVIGELKYFYYKAGNSNIFKVTFETPLKLNQCANFELGYAPHKNNDNYQPAVSHFVTVDAGFIFPPPTIEYRKETA